jgi:hypothetical protein
MNISHRSLSKGWSAAKLNKKPAALGTLTLMLFLTMFLQLIIPQVHAANVEITSVSPKTGKVGDFVNLVGKINTTNGKYQVFLGNVQVASGSASGNNVNCSFRVPSMPTGNYTLTLCDVTANINATSWFFVKTAQYVSVAKPPRPRQLQQGAKINITVSISGGKAETTYIANVTVKTPANETYYSLVSLKTTDRGEALTLLKYPENFLGNAHTNYAGIYTVAFNGTLASDEFSIGLTDQTEYHRGDTVKIVAIGYETLNGENVTITIGFGNKKVDRFNCTVSNGIVEANWTVPKDALIGNYSLNITPRPENKKVNDTQVFAVPGFKIEITSRDLAGEPVSNVLVKVFDKNVNKTYNATSNSGGVSTLWLERGEHDFTAYFKNVRVGKASSNITQEAKLNLTCLLTNLKASVVGGQNNALKVPFVTLNLSITYVTDLDGCRVENETIVSQTGVDGFAQFKSFILNASSCKIVASRYGRVFNLNNDTLTGLKPVGWNNITIICPLEALQVTVLDGKGTPISNALVEAREAMGGLRYTGYTDQEGQVSLNCLFGLYDLKVYSKGVLLNTTTAELFEEKSITICCRLYNLPIYIKVVDYFGQPIPNANVTLERNGVLIGSELTGSNGVVGFTEIGGTLTIKVYLSGQQPESTITCSIVEARDEANPIVVKVYRYVILASLLLETSWFTTIILIVAFAVLLILIETSVRRKWLKTGKTS